jgi:hypothetical protein
MVWTQVCVCEVPPSSKAKSSKQVAPPPGAGAQSLACVQGAPPGAEPAFAE